MSASNTTAEQSATPPRLSSTVRALGVVSMLTDVSSEMVYPVTPALLTRVIGAPAWTVGIIEGIAESTASILRMYAGWISDTMGRRKPLTLLGYGFGTIAKPLMAISGGWGQVLGARFLDRLGKGLRSAPRDALITETTPPEIRGKAFGFHRAMDTCGAVGGPLLGYWYLQTHPHALRSLYWLAFIPGVLAALVLGLAVRERTKPPEERKPVPFPRLTFTGLSPAYRTYLLIVALFSLGNSSDAFLLLRAQDMGLTWQHSLLLYAMFNTIEAAFSYKAGIVSDRVGRRPLIAAGFGAFALVYLGFALARNVVWIWPLFIAYGVYYTLTGGVQRAFAADLAHPDRRATEIGAFHMLVGVLALPASIVAGQLYDHVSPAAPFLLGAYTAGLAAALMLISRLEPRDHPDTAPRG